MQINPNTFYTMFNKLNIKTDSIYKDMALDQDWNQAVYKANNIDNRAIDNPISTPTLKVKDVLHNITTCRGVYKELTQLLSNNTPVINFIMENDQISPAFKNIFQKLKAGLPDQILKANANNIPMDQEAAPSDLLPLGVTKVLNYLTQGESLLHNMVNDTVKNGELSLANMVNINVDIIKATTSIGMAISTAKQIIDSTKTIMNIPL